MKTITTFVQSFTWPDIWTPTLRHVYFTHTAKFYLFLIANATVVSLFVRTLLAAKDVKKLPFNLILSIAPLFIATIMSLSIALEMWYFVYGEQLLEGRWIPIDLLTMMTLEASGLMLTSILIAMSWRTVRKRYAERL